MSRTLHAIVPGALVAVVLLGLAQAQTTPAQPAASAAQPAPPTFETKKVEGTDNATRQPMGARVLAVVSWDDGVALARLCGSSSWHWGLGVCAWRHQATYTVTLEGASRRQAADAKRGAVRRQEPARSEKQQVLLVEPCDALDRAFARCGRADQHRSAVPLQDAGKQFGATRRVAIDHQRQAFLTRLNGAGGIQQRAPLAPFVEGQRCPRGEKPFGEAQGLLEAPASIVPEIDGQGA
jgi:hypothetical protein